MPDSLGGLAPPLPASKWTERLARLKKLRTRANREDHQQRRLTRRRYHLSELIIGAIIEGGDVLAEVAIPGEFCTRKGICLLVTLSQGRFRQLCELGAELEDDEDSDGGDDLADREPDADDEPSLVTTTPGSAGTYTHGLITDGEVGHWVPEKIEAGRTRYNARITAHDYVSGGEIRTGAGELVGRESYGTVRLVDGKLRPRAGGER